MIKHLSLLLILFSQFSNAQTSLDEVFKTGSKNFGEAELSDNEQQIIKKVDELVEVNCDENKMCTIVSKTCKSRGWSVQVTVGNGNLNNSGTTIYLGGETATSSNSGNFSSLTFKYENYEHTVSVKLPQPEFENMNAQAYNQRNNGRLSDFKPLNSDARFLQLVKLEYAKLADQVGCNK